MPSLTSTQRHGTIAEAYMVCPHVTTRIATKVVAVVVRVTEDKHHLTDKVY